LFTLNPFSILVGLLLLGTAALADPASTVRHTTTGFYPLWENTGRIERHQDVYLGTSGMQYGVLDRFHVGFQPLHFLYRAPNLYAKIRLYDEGAWHVATQVEGLYLMDQAGRATLSPMYTSRLDNVGFAVLLLPVSVAVTTDIGGWLELHQAVTALPLLTKGPLENETSFGYSLVAELNGKGRHGVSLHFSEVGLWRHDFAVLGASYRYRNDWLEFRLGYFYRMRSVGTQAAPLISLAFLL
jgi:hypothetical protein